MRDFWGNLSRSVKQIKDPYLFDWEQDIAVHAMQGNRASSLSKEEVSWVSRNARWEPRVHSRVTAGVAINNFCFFSDVRTPLWLRWTPQESKLVLENNTDVSGGEAGDKGSLSSWHSDIGIPIHFQEGSGIVTL